MNSLLGVRMAEWLKKTPKLRCIPCVRALIVSEKFGRMLTDGNAEIPALHITTTVSMCFTFICDVYYVVVYLIDASNFVCYVSVRVCSAS